MHVNIKLTQREENGMRPANPYDLHEIVFNNKTIYARPIEWNGQMTDQIKQLNAFNSPVTATKIILTCPDCAINIDLDISEAYLDKYFCKCLDNIITDNGQIISFNDIFTSPFEKEDEIILIPSIKDI